MIPDGFQYFFNDFWNFQNVNQTWTCFLSFLCRNASTNTRTYGSILEQYYLSYLNILGIQKIHLLTLLDIKLAEFIFSVFCFFLILVGPKQLAYPNVFKVFFDGGILKMLEIWKIFKIIKT